MPVRSTEVIKIRVGTQEELTRVWVSLSRLASIKHRHVTQIAPEKIEFLYNDALGKIPEKGGVICVSVEAGLRPLEHAVDLSLLQSRVEQTIPPGRKRNMKPEPYSCWCSD